MTQNACPQCGAPIEGNAKFCPYCGTKFATEETPPPPPPQQPYQPQQPPYQPTPQDRIDPSWPVRSKIAAGVLGILLGSFGIHKFYLRKIGWGIVYLIFCWTCIPGIVGLIEGIVYLCTNDIDFQLKHHVRLHP